MAEQPLDDRQHAVEFLKILDSWLPLRLKERTRLQVIVRVDSQGEATTILKGLEAHGRSAARFVASQTGSSDSSEVLWWEGGEHDQGTVAVSESRRCPAEHRRGIPGDRRKYSVQMLMQHSGQQDAAAADRLAAAFGDLPLALAQAAGHLADSGMPISQYLALFQSRRGELLRRGSCPDGYQLTVFATETSRQTPPSSLRLPRSKPLSSLRSCCRRFAVR